jgi:hypothetical protein
MGKLITENQWPKYITQVRVIPLSKDNTTNPTADDIRTLSIIPTTTKYLR